MKRQIDSSSADQRADRFIKKILPGAPLSMIYRLFRKKDVRVNGKVIKEDHILRDGDLLDIYLHSDLEKKWGREPIVEVKGELHLLYEDRDILLAFKPKGMKTTPDKKGEDSLTSRVQTYLKGEAAEAFRPSPISRLDRNTQGMVLYAKNISVMRQLQGAHRCGRIKKYYLVRVFGTMESALQHSMRVIRDPDKQISRVGEEGKIAKTHFEPLAANSHETLVEAELITGRTHQIRLALSSLGFAVVGDAKYGQGGRGQWLLAYRLECPFGSWTYIPIMARRQIDKEFSDARLRADNCTMQTIRL
jgi:23S rRNA pseudouridine955/2504/2580 synthase